MNRNELLRKYLQFGFTIVPVNPGSKYPGLKTWKEYQTRKPTNAELREWFKDPLMGVGLITGKASGVIVIDEDSYKKQGKVLEIDSPLTVVTGRGGKHYYFKYKEGVRNSVNKDNAIDSRGEGGFVVLPPTIHPETQVSYEWATPLPDNLDELPTLDDSFADQIIKHKDNLAPLDLSELINIEEGTRNDSLHRLACSLLRKVSKQEAWLLIESVNQQYLPPLPDREVGLIFTSADQFISSHPKKTHEELVVEKASPLKVLTYEEATKEYETLMNRYGEGMTTGYTVLDEYFKFIPQQLYMLSATTFTGKTTLALNMAGRCARAGFKVVFASLEQGVFIIPRLKSMFGDEKGLVENMSFIAPNDLPRASDFLNTFENPENRPKILMIDHLHYFARGNRGATEETDRLVIDMQILARKLDIPVVVIAHVRKLKEEKPPEMADLKDSSSLSQIPSLVAMMHRDKNDEATVKAGGRIYSDKGTLFIYKNRIFGKTGAEPFTIYDTGEIIFDRDPGDKINRAAEVIGLEGFFND